MTETPSSPAGWFADPQSPGTERYWDGTAWTDQTRPLAPTPAAPAPQAPAPQTIVVQQKKGGTWWKILLGMFLMLVLLAGGCIALIGGTANELSTAIEEAEDERSADEALVEDTAVITSCGLGEFGTAEATVEFENPLDEEKGYISIEVSFMNADGAVVGSGTVVFENLSPGQKAIGEATSFDLADGTESVTCEVTDGTVL